MADGILSVDLRLALKRLREDIREANKMIKEGLSKSVNLGGGRQVKETRDSGAAMDTLAVKTKRVNQALADQLSAWKKLQNFRKPKVLIAGQDVMPRQDYSQYGPTLNPTQGPMGPGGGMVTKQPYLGGTPPIIPKAAIPVVPPISQQDSAVFWRRILTGGMAAMRGTGYGNIIAGNQFMGAFGGTSTGGKALGAAGLPSGAGGAAIATGALIIAVLALTAAVKTAQAAIRMSIAASERSRQLYAKSISNGLGLGFNAQRGMLAGTLGVSENEIYQFGAALAILNPRLEGAAKISAQTATTLAPLAYELKILKYDTEALFDTLAMDLAPTIRSLVQAFDSLVKAMTVLYQDVLRPMLEVIYSTATSKVGKAFIGALSNEAFGPFITELVSNIGKAISAGAGQGGFPQPQSFMKQLPVSSLERMGLVVGNSGNMMIDYARRSAVGIEKLVQHITQKGAGTGTPRTFGLDPNVANP